MVKSAVLATIIASTIALYGCGSGPDEPPIAVSPDSKFGQPIYTEQTQHAQGTIVSIDEEAFSLIHTIPIGHASPDFHYEILRLNTGDSNLVLLSAQPSTYAVGDEISVGYYPQEEVTFEQLRFSYTPLQDTLIAQDGILTIDGILDNTPVLRK